MRDSYTVTLPEEPPALPDLHKDLRPRTSMPGSLLVSTFVGLVLNKTKVGDARSPHPLAWGQRRGQPLPALGSAGCPVPCPVPEDGVPGVGALPAARGDGVSRCRTGWQGAGELHVSGHLGSCPSPALAVTLARSPCPTTRKGVLATLSPLAVPSEQTWLSPEPRCQDRSFLQGWQSKGQGGQGLSTYVSPAALVLLLPQPAPGMWAWMGQDGQDLVPCPHHPSLVPVLRCSLGESPAAPREPALLHRL